MDRKPSPKKAVYENSRMKKLRTTRKVRMNVARKRTERALRSKAKRAHRNSTGFKDLEES